MNFMNPMGSPDMLGVAAAFLAQVGARHLVFNFSAVQKKIITHPVTQSLILFGMFYLSTRKIVFAILLLIVYYLIMFVLINEQHPWNIISRNWLVDEGILSEKERNPRELYYENISKLP
jgi:hypothetical protein